MSNLIELSRRLHQERLFTKHEQETIWKLNKQVQSHAEQVSHLFWITRQHYLNLNKLVVNNAQGTSAACCKRSHSLDLVQFVDGCKELGYQEETMYGQFLEAFINNPTLAAACLAYGDKLGLEATADVAHTVVLCCYGNSIMADDHKHLLELMETLMLLQLASEDQPRRLLHKRSYAFSVVLKLFMESLPLGKLFLTFALNKSVLEVLMDDDLLLETNQQKILAQLSSNEIERRFGNKDNPSFQETMQEHTRNAEKQLSKICLSFINNIFSALSCFPQSLGWIIAKSYQIVKDAGIVSKEEAKALCADIFLQQFVCPAIVNPELYGVTGDVPVSDLSRANLMQIAQVLQLMAHTDEAALRPDSIHSHLNTDPMQSLIDAVINSCSSDTLPTTHKSPLGYANSAVFFTPFQLAQMIQFLKEIQDSGVRGVDQSSLKAVLDHLPNQAPSCIDRALIQLIPVVEDEGVNKSGHLTPSGSSGDLADHISPGRRNAKTLKSKRYNRKDDVSDGSVDDSGSGDVGMSRASQADISNDLVLVITLNSLSGSSQELLGTLTETEVMDLQNRQNMSSSSANLPPENASLDARSLTETEGIDKRSRFSLYSGGSDLSEIDEVLPTEDGISRTSASSSLDIDPAESVPPDDASSFHAVSIPAENQDEDEEGVDQGSVSRTNNDEALKALRQKLPTSRGESIEDRMRKFEIRQELGVRFADPGVTGGPRSSGQTGGTVLGDTRSETWSIDAYASDSEPQTEQESQAERLQELVEENSQPVRNPSNLGSFVVIQREEDSRSDVWSVEVLASDSETPDVQTDERLREFEAEAAAANPNEDVLEDNRSRASTPGLSAASGFSGVSALSAVSESQAKAIEDAWASSEKSFGKDPFSVSPDADDLLQLGKGESISGGSNSTGNGQNTIGSRKIPQPSKSQQSPPLIVRNSKEIYESSKKLRSAGQTGKSDDVILPKPTSSVNKTVAWNVTDLSLPSTDRSKSPSHDPSGLGLSDIEAIKKNSHKPDRGAMLDSDLKRSASPAWDAKQELDRSPIPADGSLNVSSSNLLKDFDPLLQDGDFVSKSAIDKNNANLLKPTTVTANGSIDAGSDKPSFPAKQSEVARVESDKVPSPRSASPRLPLDGSRSLDRKKSWWKNFSKRSKVPAKLSALTSPSNNGDVPRFRNATEPSFFEESEKPPKKITSEKVTSPVDDIMQKYMQKASKSHARVDIDPASGNNDRLSRSKTPETSDPNQNRNTKQVSDVSSNIFEVKWPNSADPSPSVPLVSAGTGAFRNTESVSGESDLKSSVKNEIELKEEAKRKLRIVFSTAEPLPESPSIDLLLLGIASPSTTFSFAPHGGLIHTNKLKLREHLLSFLQSQHAEALSMLLHSRVAQIDEVIRCVQALDDQSCKQVVKSLWREYKQRSSFIAYLVRSRQHLLASLSYLRHVGDCTERDKSICRRQFTDHCVRMFLKNKRMELKLREFRKFFGRGIALDEKVTLLRRCLSWFYGQMVESSIWEGAAQEQLKEAEECIERKLFSLVYKPAMFPNGDGDTNRDQVFHEHIARLSAVITPSHPSLQVSPKYMRECPWPSAQREISALAAFRTPQGKFQAALRCCRAVMHLLKMADESNVPAADDFTPVLVFVLIKANPPHLLSTLQYVDSFIGDQLGGEDAYWWMQFSAATLFIKTIDERK